MNRRVYCSFVRKVAHRGGSIVRINHAFSRDFCYEAAVEVPNDRALEVGRAPMAMKPDPGRSMSLAPAADRAR